MHENNLTTLSESLLFLIQIPSSPSAEKLNAECPSGQLCNGKLKTSGKKKYILAFLARFSRFCTKMHIWTSGTVISGQQSVFFCMKRHCALRPAATKFRFGPESEHFFPYQVTSAMHALTLL